MKQSKPLSSSFPYSNAMPDSLHDASHEEGAGGEGSSLNTLLLKVYQKAADEEGKLVYQ